MSMLIDNIDLSQIKENLLLNSFRILANGGLVASNNVDGFTDEFEDESGVDTVHSVNQSYDSSNDLYTSLSVSSKSEYYEGSDDGVMPIGNNNGNVRKAGQSFQMSVGACTVTKVGFLAVADVGSISGNVKLSVQTNNGNVPSGTLVNVNASIEGIWSENSWNEFTFDTPFNLEASTTYWLVAETVSAQAENVRGQISNDNSSPSYASGNLAYYNAGFWSAVGSNDVSFRIYASTLNNMTLLSNTIEAENQPSKAYFVGMIEGVDAITYNTDFTIEISRDEGTNYTLGNLSYKGTYDTSKDIVSCEIPLSSQNADKTIIVRMKTLNDKVLKIHGYGILWE